MTNASRRKSLKLSLTSLNALQNFSPPQNPYHPNLDLSLPSRPPGLLTCDQTGIANTSATHIYIAPSTSYVDADPSAPKIRVGTANFQLVRSCATSSLPIPQVGHDFPTKGYVIPSFANNLVGICPLYDTVCYITFAKHDVTVYNPRGRPIPTGWRDYTITRRFVLQLHPTQIPTPHAAKQTASLIAFSAYNLPSVGSLVRYLHATAGLPLKSTWLKAIKAK